MNLFLHDPQYPRMAMHAHRMLAALGVSRLPAEGMPEREIQGIIVWVTPLPAERPKRGRPHRVMGRCPMCGKEMSAGRLPQHSKIHR